MRPPRFRLAWGMVVVAFIALNLGLARASLGLNGDQGVVACAASLPMANALLVASLGARRRPFLRGFVLFGMIALACSLLVVWSSPDVLTRLFLQPVFPLVRAILGPDPSFQNYYRLLAALVVVSAWAAWPQLCFALVGGYLFRRFSGNGDASPGA